MSERFNYLQAWSDTFREPILTTREQYEKAESDYWDLMDKLAAVRALRAVLANKLKEEAGGS